MENQSHPDGLRLWAIDLAAGILWLCTIGTICALIAMLVMS